MKIFIRKILYLSCMFGLLNTSYAALESSSDEELETLSAEIETPSIEPVFIAEPEPQSTVQESQRLSSSKLAYTAYEQYLKDHVNDVEFKKLADLFEAENKLDELIQLHEARAHENELLEILKIINESTDKISDLQDDLSDLQDDLYDALVCSTKNNFLGRLGIDHLLAYTIFSYCKAKLSNKFINIMRVYATENNQETISQYQEIVGKSLNYYDNMLWNIKDLNSNATRALLHEINRVRNAWRLYDLMQIYTKIVLKKQKPTEDMKKILYNYFVEANDSSHPQYSSLYNELYKDDIACFASSISAAITANQ